MFAVRVTPQKVLAGNNSTKKSLLKLSAFAAATAGRGIDAGAVAELMHNMNPTQRAQAVEMMRQLLTAMGGVFVERARYVQYDESPSATSGSVIVRNLHTNQHRQLLQQAAGVLANKFGVPVPVQQQAQNTQNAVINLGGLLQKQAQMGAPAFQAAWNQALQEIAALCGNSLYNQQRKEQQQQSAAVQHGVKETQQNATNEFALGSARGELKLVTRGGKVN